MSKVALVIFLLCALAGRSIAQNYFVLIEAGNRQPFYARLDGQFHSSSSEGHLILSQLRDSNYSITIGFPGQTSPELHYEISIGHKDQDFELRNEADGGWRLYNRQAGDWLKPLIGEGNGAGPQYTGTKKDDAFSRMMAGVVHDTAVLYNTYAMEQALSDSPAVTAIPSDRRRPLDLGASSTLAVLHSAAPQFDTATTLYRPSTGETGVKKISERKLAHSVRLVYADKTKDKTDTVVVIIPVDTPAKSVAATSTTRQSHPADSTLTTRRPQPTDTALATRQPHPTDTALADNQRQPKDTALAASKPHPADTTHLFRKHNPNPDSSTRSQPLAARPAAPRPTEISHPVTTRPLATRPVAPSSVANPPAEAVHPHPADSPQRQAKATPHITDSPQHEAKAIPYVNSDCHDFANDFDVDKLREKLLSATSDNARIVLAGRMFKVKCFYTPQIRVLSEVFDNDASRFRFLETAWPFAADEHFHELANLLTDPVYIGKFKTLTARP